MSKEIVEAVPVIEDGFASFEFVLRFPFDVHLEGWREVMELRQKRMGELCDWSQAVPNEFYALCDSHYSMHGTGKLKRIFWIA